MGNATGFLDFARNYEDFALQKHSISLAYSAMRFGICCAIWLLLGIELASSQTQKTASPTPTPAPTPTPTPTPAFPEFRPALIGSGPNSVIHSRTSGRTQALRAFIILRQARR